MHACDVTVPSGKRLKTSTTFGHDMESMPFTPTKALKNGHRTTVASVQKNQPRVFRLWQSLTSMPTQGYAICKLRHASRNITCNSNNLTKLSAHDWSRHAGRRDFDGLNCPQCADQNNRKICPKRSILTQFRQNLQKIRIALHPYGRFSWVH